MIGDSISAQNFVNLHCSLESQAALDTNRPDVHVLRAPPPHNHTAYVSLERTNVLYNIDQHAHELDYSSYHWSDQVPAGRAVGRKLVLLINTGAWFSQHKLHEEFGLKLASPHDADRVFQRTIDELFDHTLAEFRGVVFFRAISPGHTSGCEAAHSPLFNWDSFDRRNDYVREVSLVFFGKKIDF